MSAATDPLDEARGILAASPMSPAGRHAAAVLQTDALGRIADAQKRQATALERIATALEAGAPRAPRDVCQCGLPVGPGHHRACPWTREESR